MTVVSLALARASASGDPEAVLDAVETALLDDPASAQAVTAFYEVFWLALEDEALAERAGALDARLCARKKSS